MLSEEGAKRDAELEAEERQMAARVREGVSVAVYARDDEMGNAYYLAKAGGGGVLGGCVVGAGALGGCL